MVECSWVKKILCYYLEEKSMQENHLAIIEMWKKRLREICIQNCKSIKSQSKRVWEWMFLFDCRTLAFRINTTKTVINPSEYNEFQTVSEFGFGGTFQLLTSIIGYRFDDDHSLKKKLLFILSFYWNVIVVDVLVSLFLYSFFSCFRSNQTQKIEEI